MEQGIGLEGKRGFEPHYFRSLKLKEAKLWRKIEDTHAGPAFVNSEEENGLLKFENTLRALETFNFRSGASDVGGRLTELDNIFPEFVVLVQKYGETEKDDYSFVVKFVKNLEWLVEKYAVKAGPEHQQELMLINALIPVLRRIRDEAKI